MESVCASTVCDNEGQGDPGGARLDGGAAARQRAEGPPAETSREQNSTFRAWPGVGSQAGDRVPAQIPLFTQQLHSGLTGRKAEKLIYYRK